MRAIFLLICLVPMLAFGNDDILRPSEITSTPPVLDGKLDDEVWKNATTVSGFKTFRPDFGMDMEYETEVYMAYDAENIYFAFKCYDDPNLIKTSLSPRDRIQDDDWVCINLDSFNDSQTIYGFYVNPSGIQRDTRSAGFREDEAVDFVWYSAGEINDEGYNVEVRIPFKSIRYANKNNLVKMGVVFERRVTRNSVNATYPPLDPALGDNFLIQMMDIQYEGIKKNKLVEVLPAVTFSKNSRTEEGVRVSDKSVADIGVTGKIGLTSDLVLDLTVNPDFSQVESDVGQVDDNQRFALFFPERRPFFQEGSENFNFSGGNGREGIRSIVNTRTITNPIFAAKLTGKIGDKNRISAIFAQDEMQEGSTDPYADFEILRYRRSFTNDSYLGGFFTRRSENGGSNSVAGADFNYRFAKNHTIEAYYMKVYDREFEAPSMTTDYATAFSYGYSTRRIFIRARFNDNSENFTSDVGYVGRVGVTTFNIFAGPKIYFDSDFLQRIDNWISLTRTYDKPGGLWEKSYYFNARLNLIRNSRFSVALNDKTEVFDGQVFNRDNLRVEAESQLNKRINLNLSYRFGKLIRYVSDPYSGYGKNITGQLNLQLSDKINTQWRYTFSDFYREDNRELDFTRTLVRSRNTYQVNKFLFFRAIVEYDSRDPDIAADFLASFTLIPGTVVHIGYGSILNKMQWDDQLEDYVATKDRFESFRNGFFFKASYLFRS